MRHHETPEQAARADALTAAANAAEPWERLDDVHKSQTNQVNALASWFRALAACDRAGLDLRCEEPPVKLTRESDGVLIARWRYAL